MESLRRRHQALRDKANQRRNARPEEFQAGDQVKVWVPKQKRFAEPGTVDLPIPGDDMTPRSYKIVLDNGRVKHVAAAWLVRAAAEE